MNKTKYQVVEYGGFLYGYLTIEDFNTEETLIRFLNPHYENSITHIDYCFETDDCLSVEVYYGDSSMPITLELKETK